MWSKLKEKIEKVKPIAKIIGWCNLMAGFTYVSGWLFGNLILKVIIAFSKDFFNIED